MIDLKGSLNKGLHWVCILLFALLAIIFEVEYFNIVDENLDLVEQTQSMVSFFESRTSALEESLFRANVKLSSFQQNEKDQIIDRIKHLQPKLDIPILLRIVNAVFDSCEKYSLSPSVVVHLMFRESSFRHMITSDKGAVGLMQVHPPSHPEKVGKVPRLDLYGIEANIGFGCQILAEYLGSSGSLKEALGKYLGRGHRKADVQAVLDLVAEYENVKWRKGK